MPAQVKSMNIVARRAVKYRDSQPTASLTRKTGLDTPVPLQ
ncbi:MAG: hypothetical protein WDZ48_05430 [Pirellulales bacterium]